MKKFAWAGLLAIGLLGFTQQQASAWFNFSVGASVNLHFSWGCGGCQPDPWQCNPYAGAAYGSEPYYGGYAMSGYSGDYAPAAMAQQQAPAAPRTQAAQYQPAGNAAGYQPVNYNPYSGQAQPYYAPQGYGYSYGQAPGYWYGR